MVAVMDLRRFHGGLARCFIQLIDLKTENRFHGVPLSPTYLE